MNVVELTFAVALAVSVSVEVPAPEVSVTGSALHEAVTRWAIRNRQGRVSLERTAARHVEDGGGARALHDRHVGPGSRRELERGCIKGNGQRYSQVGGVDISGGGIGDLCRHVQSGAAGYGVHTSRKRQCPVHRTRRGHGRAAPGGGDTGGQAGDDRRALAPAALEGTVTAPSGVAVTVTVSDDIDHIDSP